MIYGLGTDIAKVERFEKWVKNPEMIDRFFNRKEVTEAKSEAARCEHYAVRFAAKEAFSKALGTGIRGFDLNEVYITNNEDGKPSLNIEGKAKKLMEERCGKNTCVHVSLSHEKEYAVAFVVIEIGG